MEQLEQAFTNPSELTSYKAELLQLSKVNIDRSLRCLKIVKTLLGGDVFDIVLAEVKGNAVEGRPI